MPMFMYWLCSVSRSILHIIDDNNCSKIWFGMVLPNKDKEEVLKASFFQEKWKTTNQKLLLSRGLWYIAWTPGKGEHCQRLMGESQAVLRGRSRTCKWEQYALSKGQGRCHPHHGLPRSLSQGWRIPLIQCQAHPQVLPLSLSFPGSRPLLSPLYMAS